MQDLISNPEPTMSTVDLLDIISHARSINGDRPIRYNDFMNRVSDELDGEYYETFVVQNPNKTESMAAMLTRDQCFLVAMRESKAVRRYVLERLKELEAQQAPKVPTTMAEALRLAADQAEELERQQAQLEAQKPAVEFVERHASAEGLTGLQQTGKLLKHPPRKFVGWLQDDEYLFRSGGSLTPYQRYIDQGLFEVIVIEKHGHARPQTMITPKGIQYFAKRFAPEITH